jgi:hypothetical protein
MTYPEVQFVAAPEDGAEVLFDFNDDFDAAPSAIIAGSFTLGAPSVEGDPDGLGVQYGAREVGFDVLIYGNRHAAMQTQALMARTFMLRRRGWLRVKMDFFSSPVWLRTYTPTPAELDFSLITADEDADDAWRLEVRVAAEPFIRGERVELWSGTINNDPAHATNPLGVLLPAVIGDAPAPLRIEATFSVTRNWSDIFWSTSAVPDSWTPTVWQIGASDGWTVGTDTGAASGSAEMSGGSYRPVSFAVQPIMWTRISGVAPSSPAPGRYKVMLRVAVDNGPCEMAIRFGYNTTTGQKFDGSKVATVGRTSASPVMHTWVDLGDFDFPLPRTSLDMAGVAATPNIALQAQLISGTANLLLDAFKLIPLSLESTTTLETYEQADVLVSEFASTGPQSIANEVQVWDGDSEMSLRRSPSGVLDALTSGANRGRFPTVRPGVSNALTYIQQTRTQRGAGSADPLSDGLTAYAAVTVSYQPRWLWLGDA